MKKYKSALLILSSFLIPFTIITVIFFIKGIFTDKTILSGDMHAQYYPLFYYLKGVFDGTNSIFYSFNKGLGGPMFGTIFYYLSSPLNILLFFIKKNSIATFMKWLIIFKLSLCGLTMYIYMRKKYKKDSLIILSLSICYALMGYNLNYFINIMWLDVVVMTPLVLIGIEKIIQDKSPLFYIIMLFITIFSNYYLAYMLCIFCILYFIYIIILKYDIKKDKDKIKTITKKFIISSFLSGLMCSFFLIPCILEMRYYGRGISVREILTFDYNFFDLFSKSYIGTLDLNDTLNYSSMNIYCTILALPLLYTYFSNDKIRKKEKQMTLLLLLLMIMPCFIGALNWIWHLFTKPMFYSYRYSFVLCFFIINIIYKSYEKLKIKKINLLLYLTFYLIISFYFIIITYFGKYYSFLNYKLIWLTLFILIIYLGIIILIKSKKKRDIILSILIILECTLNTYIIFNKNSFNERNIEKNEYENIIEKYRSNNRIEISDSEKSFNNDLMNEYQGVNIFLSTTNYKVLNFLTKVGLNETHNTNIYTIDYDSILLNTIIGLKTIISPDSINYKKLDLIEKDDKIYVYQNEQVPSIGYIIKNKFNNIEYEYPYDEKIFNCIFGMDNKYYKEYKPKIDGTSINLEKKGYLYMNTPNLNSIENDIFDEQSKKNIIYINYNYIILDNNKKNTRIIVDGKTDLSNLKIYYFDYEEYKKALKNIKLEQIEYEINKDELNAKINTSGGLLMLTIPYEDGIEIYVDGKPTKYEQVLDTFIGVSLEKGIHEIELKYKEPGLKSGIILSALSLIITIIYVKRSEENEKK